MSGRRAGRGAVERLRRREARRRRVPRVDVPRPPLHVERRYAAALRRRVDELHRLILSEVGRVLDRVAADLDERARLDSVAADLDALLRAITVARGVWIAASPTNTSELYAIGEQLDLFARRQVAGQVRDSVVALDVLNSPAIQTEIAGWARSNAEAIRGLELRHLDEVAAAVREGVTNGESARTVAERIARRAEVSRGRARFIARDQIGSLFGEVTRERQQRIGVSRYRWQTSEDDRVRPSHVELNGRVFEWDHPPSVGHPGADINCRCVAIAVFD